MNEGQAKDMIKQLIYEKDRAEAVIRSVAQGLVVLDNDDRIIEISPTATVLLGIKEKDVVGKRIPKSGAILGCEGLSAVFSDRRHEPKEVSYERREETAGKPAWSKEVELEEPEKRTLRVTVSSLRDDKGQSLGRVFILGDITRERESEQMKTDFVSLVSHELRTPLTSIIGFISLILSGKTGEITELQRETLEKVKRQSDRLHKMINDVLDISRIEAERMSLKEEMISLTEIVQNRLEEMRPQADARKLTISLQASPELPKIKGDAARIEQVFGNLLGNAVKYCRVKGRVSVRIVEKKNMLLTEITDNGPGIPRREFARVFDKFHRVGDATTRKEEGTGLGLPIAKGIVEAHRGKMWIESEVGKYTRFSFSLPLTKELAPEALLKKKRILVVDDEADVISMIKMALESETIKVDTAYDGLSALAKAREVKPDLIFLDVMMPVLDGFSVCRKLKSDDKTRHIPVILFTGTTEDYVKRRVKEAGADDFLLKPIEPAKLEDKLKVFLGG